MTYFLVDVETDGPAPHLFSMVSFGVVVLDKTLTHTFYGKVRPISKKWDPEALAVSGHTREETLTFPKASVVLPEFSEWVRAHTKKGTQARFVSDCSGFDFGFMNYYLWRFTGENVFGYSSRDMEDIYRGMTKNMRSSFDKLRVTAHDHHPVNDALGNAEALLKMREKGLRLQL